MLSRRLQRAFFFLQLSCAVAAYTAHGQAFGGPISTGKFAGILTSLDASQTVRIDSNAFLINTQNRDLNSPLQSPSGSVSPLDLKAPGKARREYEKGYQLLMKKDLQAAIEHLTKSIEIYPSFVAAHNALGTAYLNQGMNQQAQEQFTKAVDLDDHLPNSYLNLGCAQLALQQNADAETSLKKASLIAPLDLQLLTALTYAEFQNHDYAGVIATARQVHDRKHRGAAQVHYFAAGALEAQGDLVGAQQEMQTLLKEDSKSPSAAQFRQILDQLRAEQVADAQAKTKPHLEVALTPSPETPSFAGPTSEEVFRRAQQGLQEKNEEIQIAEAEAQPDPTCAECRTDASPLIASAAASSSATLAPDQRRPTSSGAMLRVAVDEVAVFFAATDHGRSITNLAASDIQVRDDSRPPDSILSFRNESQLPLRLGLIIDTSSSVTDRFAFEQASAAKFLKTAITDKSDLAFVVGVNNSVLVVQDFTADQSQMEHAVSQLAPGGGTALWDAVAFAADKLAKHAETQPVARMLVVISDGKDNSSSVTLKQAIARAQQGEVAVYTVSTRDSSLDDTSSHRDAGEFVGDHALKTLSELTGGSAFTPGSVRGLNGSLADLQQVIRGRYLVSYKPSAFQLDGHYRPIEIKAQKDGQKLTVYARKGYYATPPQPPSPQQEPPPPSDN